MNIYTAEELTALIKKFTISDNKLSRDNISIKSGRHNFLVNENTFISIVFLDPILNPLDFIKNEYIPDNHINELINIRRFIYEVPLYQVPLYINIYEEIVEWRLLIGK
jgi:hypothetical protein